MRFRISRPLLAARLFTFVGAPLALTWAALLWGGGDTVNIVAGIVITSPVLLYAVLALRFQVRLEARRMLIRVVGTHAVPLQEIRAISIKQRGLRMVVVVDTVEHGWVTLPAPLALTFWGRERFERQHEAMTDWWEAGRA